MTALSSATTPRKTSRSKQTPTWVWIAGGSGVLLLLGILIAIFANNGSNDDRVAGRTGGTTKTAREALASGTTGSSEPTNESAPLAAAAPFTASQAVASQEAWARHLGIPVEYTNSIGMKFRLIPPGEFLMGSASEEIEAALKAVGFENWREYVESEAPRHKVILTKPIYVGVTEVTQLQYEQVMGSNPSYFSATGGGKGAVVGLQTGMHPVELVSWYDAVDFCVKLSQRESRRPFHLRSGDTVTALAGDGYRLPTEAEWEYACRAGTTTRAWSGDTNPDLSRTAWFDSNSGARTHAVGELAANPFGLSDVHGNVWEWVQDSWDPSFYKQFQETAAIDPVSPPSDEHNRRVFRGGNWNSSSFDCRSSFRLALSPASRTNYVGIRVVLPAENLKSATSIRPVTLSRWSSRTEFSRHSQKNHPNTLCLPRLGT